MTVKPGMKALLITGGRAFDDEVLVDRILRDERPDLVIHGCARTWVEEGDDGISGHYAGADHFASVWCGQHAVVECRFPADWSTHGPKAGPIRNTEEIRFLEALDFLGYDCKVVAFPGGDGTADTVKKAQKAQFEVRTITDED
jgi:hypothetical protein